MYCVRVFAIVYVFVCTIVVCGCICLYVHVPPIRKSGCADHCEVKSISYVCIVSAYNCYSFYTCQRGNANAKHMPKSV